MDIVKEHFPNCVRPSSYVDWLDLLRKSLFITAEVQQIKHFQTDCSVQLHDFLNALKLATYWADNSIQLPLNQAFCINFL